MDTEILSLNPKDLQVGDVVHCHGMLCLVTDAPTISSSHSGGDTYCTETRVLNRYEVPNSVVPFSFTESRSFYGVHTWVVQGNSLAWLYVERKV